MTTGTSSTFTDASAGSDEYGSSKGGSGNGENPLAEAGQQAGQSVGVLTERATDLGFQQADKAREQAADGLGQVTDSIRRVSMDMEGDQPAIANVVTTAADQADRIADYLRTTDARQILSTVEDVARRQPLIFLGGAFVLGLAASRLLKAAGGSSSQPGQSGYGQEWTSGGGEYQAATGPGASMGSGTDALTRDDRIGEGI